jgi:lipoprotein NlpD
MRFIKHAIIFTIPLVLLLACLILSGCGYYHTVKKGDTVYSIAQKYGVSQDRIISNNNIRDPRTLQVGQQLKIPRSQTQSTKPQYKKPANKKPQKTPTVAKGTVRATPKPKATPRPVPPVAAVKLGFVWPTKGVVISSYGKRGDGRTNDGIDIGAPEGANVVASASGEVVMSSDKFPAYGNMIVIKHKNDYVTLYAHNSTNIVQKGDKVIQGQKIAKVGSTGRVSTPMLHFEVRRVSTSIDPLSVLPAQ